MKFKNIMIEGSVEGSGKTYSPLDGIKAGFQADVVSINLGSNTNLKTLLAGKERLIFPNECAKLTVNDKEISPISVEGIMDGSNARVFFFMEDLDDAIDESENETAVVKISFTNPQDATMQLKFIDGRFEGETVPNITDMAATFEEGLGNFYTNLAKVPEVDSATPELNSINLPLSTNVFKVTFTGKVDCSLLTAKFDDAAMTVAPADGFASEVTLTRAAGDATTGVHTITISNIKPEQDYTGETGTATLKYSFGIMSSDETVVTYMTDNFTESGNGTVPAAWVVNNEGEERSDVTGLWGGCRLVGANSSFAPVVLYLCSRGKEGNAAYAYYGTKDEKLTLDPKTYHLTFDAANWDNDTKRGVHVQVVTEETVDGDGNITGGGDVLADELVIVSNKYDKGGDCTHADIEFTVTETANIVLKFFSTDENGNAAGWGDAIAMANVKVQYIPNVMGIELIQSLNEALAKAKTSRDNNVGERFAGEAFTALNALVTKYETEPVTAPSAFQVAVAELNAAVEAMDAHHTLCEDFDKLPAQLLTSLDKYAESKYATDKIYTSLQAAFDKYATVKSEEIDVEGTTQTVRTAVPNAITDDAELTAGISEMKNALALTDMFTEGTSQNGTKGYAALHERLRLGVATATALGVAADNAAVVAANAELGDDDAVANNLKAEITKQLYTTLKEGTEIDPVDMTVFIKNPNIYVTKANDKDFSDAMAPGWTLTNLGSGSIGGNWGTNGGGGHVATDAVPADEALTIQYCPVTFTQQISDLPAGVYTFTAYLGERRGDNDLKGAGEGETDEEKLESARSLVFPQEFLFVNTTETAADTYDNQTPVASNGKSWGCTADNRIVTGNITIIDGKATVGVKGSDKTWFAFNGINLTLVSAAASFDYAKALEEIATAIETLDAAPAQVRAIEMYDINGRRIAKAQKGVILVKKLMSDGSVRTAKVVVK